MQKESTLVGEATVINPPTVIIMRQKNDTRDIEVGQSMACKNATVGVIKTLKI